MLTAQLDVSKFGKDGELCFRQPARSFLQNFISLLYTAFAQVDYGIPDIDGIGRTVRGSGYIYDYRGVNLAVTPSGKGKVLVPNECIGVQVGASDAAVTPTDIDLGSRIHHVDRMPETANVVMDALQYPGATTFYYIYTDRWAAAPFRVPWAFNLYTCKLRAFRGTDVSDRTLTVGLRKCDGSGRPTGADLILGTVDGAILQGLPEASPGTLLEVTFDSPYIVRPHTHYALVARLDGGSTTNSVRWIRSNVSNIYLHKERTSRLATSSDSGASWTLDTNYNQFFYQLLGRRPVGLCYHGTVVRELISSAPNIQFTIEAFFSNYCGSPVTVREMGIYANGNINDSYEAKSFLIARDVLSTTVTVADGEVLRVRYVVQITV